MSESEFALDKQQLLHYWQQQGLLKNQALARAFLQVPRQQFVPANLRSRAYKDNALPIEANQTISQPTTVMLMLNLLDLPTQQSVLEIGTGSGYNVALLAQLSQKIYSIERITSLHQKAYQNLRFMNLENVELMLGDGKLGYAEKAPYARIILTAGTRKVPKGLLKQLAMGGILLAPVGRPEHCLMTKIHKKPTGLVTTTHGWFSFVPLV